MAAAISGRESTLGTSLLSLSLEAASCVHTEGQQLLGVHVVERAQVRQLQQQLGETGGIPWSTDQTPERPDEALLKHLNSVHILNS